jgi:hypothetical protein
MPYYGSNNADPSEMQQMGGNPFYNPLQSSPDWVRGIQHIYAMMEQGKQKKKAEGEAADNKFKEAMLFQLKLREEKDSAKLRAKQLEKLERDAKDYVPAGAKNAAEMLAEGFRSARDQKNKIAEIEARGKQDRETAGARERANLAAKKGQTDAIKKQYLAAKKAIEAAHSKELADIETKYTSQVAGVRASASKPNSTMLAASPMPNNYLIGLTGARSAYKRMKDEAANRLKEELTKLDESYKEALSMTDMPQEPQAQQTQQAEPEVYVNDKGVRIYWDGSAWVPIK